MIAACRIVPVSFVHGLCIIDAKVARSEGPDLQHAEFTMLPQGKATSVEK